VVLFCLFGGCFVCGGLGGFGFLCLGFVFFCWWLLFGGFMGVVFGSVDVLAQNVFVCGCGVSWCLEGALGV